MPERIQTPNPYNRPPRAQITFRPIELEIPAPPSKPEEGVRNFLLSLLPVSSMLVMAVMYGLIYGMRSNGMGGAGWIFALPMMLMGLVTVVSSLVMQGEQRHHQKMNAIRQMRDYHRTLDKKEARLLAARQLESNALNSHYPELSETIRKVQTLELSLWERRKEDGDFLCMRIGRGDIRSAMMIKPPDPDTVPNDLRRPYNIFTTYRQLPNAPVILSLASVGSLGIVGKRRDSLQLANALLAQIVTYHSPDEVAIYVFGSKNSYKELQWLRWLPHCSSEHVGGHPTRMAFGNEAKQRLMNELARSLDPSPEEGETTAEPGLHRVVLVDRDANLQEDPILASIIQNGIELRASVIVLSDILENLPSDCRSVVQINSAKKFAYWKTGADSDRIEGWAETMDYQTADNLSHKLIPVAARSIGAFARIPSRVNLLQTYDVQQIEGFRIRERWGQVPDKDGLLPFPVLVGNETRMNPLALHLAENRDGPHGLVAGTTGSGKSELLQTLVTAMAVEHHPYYLNFLLIDFKGGSAFQEFADLPHTVGMVSNLDKASALRALEAIKAENIRRQAFLNAKGFKDILRYHERIAVLKEIPPDWEPLPHLFIIVDEFAQLAKEMPTFMPELMALLRVGRALGLHLILATQRPAGVVTDEMRSNLNFRICLRVQNTDDSKDILRRPDAGLLPKDIPGRAFFQVGDGGASHQFQTARVAVDYLALAKEQDSKDPILYLLEDEEEIPLQVWEERADQAADETKDTQSYISNILIAEMKQLYEQMQKKNKLRSMDMILLPPLNENLAFSAILPYISNGWNGSTWSISEDRAQLRAVVGLLDDLANRDQPPFWIEFQTRGNLLVLGSPATGKTTFLRPRICSLAYQYSPVEVNIFVLSFAGKALGVLRGFPQVGDIVVGGETEKLQRLLRHLNNELEVRKNLMGIKGVDSLAEFNKLVDADDRLPSIIVMIDNFGELRDPDYMSELDEIVKLIENGRSAGIYLVCTFLQFGDVPHKVLNLVDQRIALNLTDKGDYSSFVGRPNSLEFDALPAGRGFRNGNPPMQFQIATTTVENSNVDENQPKPILIPDLIDQMQKEWGPRRAAPEILTLPQRINLSTLFPQSNVFHSTLSVPLILGRDGDTLGTFYLDWDKNPPHLLVGGPSQSGRTSVLQSIVLSIANTYSPDEAAIVLVDGTQTSLRRLKGLPHVIAWVTEEEALDFHLRYLIEELKKRREIQRQLGDEAPGELSQRINQRIFFVIDDYDLTKEVLPIKDNLIAALSKHIRRDYDLNFHFILSCNAQSLARDLDPLVKQIKLLRGGISLVNHEAMENLGVKVTTAMRKQEFTEGRGYFINRNRVQLVQFAYPDDDSLKVCVERWVDRPKAVWMDDLVLPDQENPETDWPGGSTSNASETSNLGWFDNLDELEEQYIRLRRQEMDNGKDQKS